MQIIKNLIHTLFFILVLTLNCFAQTDDKNLNEILNSGKADTMIVNELNTLCEDIIIEDPELSLKYSEKAFEISQKANYIFGKAYSLYNTGTSYYYVDDYEKAFLNLKQSEKLFTEINNDFGLGSVYNAYGEIYTLQGEYGKSIKDLFNGLRHFEEIKNQTGIAKVNNNIGLIYKLQGEFEEALKYFFIAYEKGNKISKGDASQNIGASYLGLKNYSEATKYLNIAIDLGTQNNDLYVLSTAKDYLGVIELHNNNLLEAKKLFEESIEMKIEIEDDQGTAVSLNNLGKVYIKYNNLDSAVSCFEKSKQIAEDIGVKKELADSYEGLAIAYKQKNEYSKAIEYLDKAYIFLNKFTEINKEIVSEEASKKLSQKQVEIAEEKKNKEILLLKKDQEIQSFRRNIIYAFALSIIVVMLIVVYFIYKQYKIKKKSNNQLLHQNQIILQHKEEILTQAEQLEITNKELEKLSIVASETNNAVIIADGKGKIEWINVAFTRIFGYTIYEFTDIYGDNLFDTRAITNIENLKEQLFEKKQAITYESKIVTKSNKQLWVQTSLTPVVDSYGEIYKFVAIDSDITIIKEAEEEIRHQQKEITDSIKYAKKIQSANIPSTETLVKNFSDHFILFKPKDIVSGDFYWFYELEGKTIFAVADCTGHGVPGAFMSMLGIAFLKEIIVKEYITHSAVILNKLRKEIIRSLQHQGKEMENKDGMDIALCVVDNETKLLEYSGANNPLYLIRKTDNFKSEEFKEQSPNIQILESSDLIFIEIKPDKMPIGLYEKMDKFSQKSLQLYPSDSIYLSSDGYPDQFGGPKLKKFMHKRFKELIIANCTLPMSEQMNLLDSSIENWKSGTEQTDDVTVLGIKI